MLNNNPLELLPGALHLLVLVSGLGAKGGGVSNCTFEFSQCIATVSTYCSRPQCALFLFPASQCNVSLKKQRSRSILSSFFCCFRDYNVEAPPTSSPSLLPPLVEENGGLQKVSLDGEPWTQQNCSSCISVPFLTNVLNKSLWQYGCSHLLQDPKLPEKSSFLLKEISVIPM